MIIGRANPRDPTRPRVQSRDMCNCCNHPLLSWNIPGSIDLRAALHAFLKCPLRGEAVHWHRKLSLSLSLSRQIRRNGAHDAATGSAGPLIRLTTVASSRADMEAPSFGLLDYREERESPKNTRKKAGTPTSGGRRTVRPDPATKRVLISGEKDNRESRQLGRARESAASLKQNITTARRASRRRPRLCSLPTLRRVPFPSKGFSCRDSVAKRLPARPADRFLCWRATTEATRIRMTLRVQRVQKIGFFFYIRVCKAL
jgi:hypothetical protein